MSELISGKEALGALMNGELVECKNDAVAACWLDANGLQVRSFLDSTETWEFRIKPRTITLNGIEVPACGAEYKPNTYMFILNSLDPNEYSTVILDESDEIPAYWWRTEDEIKQVVSALRSVFGKKMI